MAIIGVCGDDCTRCPRFIATQSGDWSQLAGLAALWVRLGFRDALPEPEELACRGCTPSSPCAYADQRQCALERHFSNCGECVEYPCELASRGLARSDVAAEHCRRMCSAEEWEVFRGAFFSKRENLGSRR